MQYMCLIYTDPAVWQTMCEDDRAGMLADYGTFTESIRKSGHFVAGDALQPLDTATTVRVRRRQDASSPTARSRRRRSSSAATTSSKPRTSTRRSSRRAGSPARATARSRCGR